jgi:hypothetical protein
MSDYRDYRDYLVTISEEAGGPDAAMRERFAACLAYRLASLESRDGYFPAPGDPVDMLDNLEGKYFWEMTDDEVAQNPPSRIDYEIVSVDPADRPAATETPVRILARVPF